MNSQITVALNYGEVLYEGIPKLSNLGKRTLMSVSVVCNSFRDGKSLSCLWRTHVTKFNLHCLRCQPLFRIEVGSGLGNGFWLLRLWVRILAIILNLPNNQVKRWQATRKEKEEGGNKEIHCTCSFFKLLCVVCIFIFYSSLINFPE